MGHTTENRCRFARAASRRWRASAGTAAAAARFDGLEWDRVAAAAGEEAEEAAGDDGLADAGVGAGDEEAGVHARARKSR